MIRIRINSYNPAIAGSYIHSGEGVSSALALGRSDGLYSAARGVSAYSPKGEIFIRPRLISAPCFTAGA